MLFYVFFALSLMQSICLYFKKTEKLFLGFNENAPNLQNGKINNPFSKLDLFFQRVLQSKSNLNSFSLTFKDINHKNIYNIRRNLDINQTKIEIAYIFKKNISK